MGQIKVKFFIRGRIRPLITVVFTDKVQVEKVISEITTDYAIVNDVVITKDSFKYAKIKE